MFTYQNILLGLSKNMMQNKVLELLNETTLKNGVKLPAKQELEIVQGVVYMGGFPIPFDMQPFILNWINDNPKSFKETTKNW
jgi:hypothetical protein